MSLLEQNIIIVQISTETLLLLLRPANYGNCTHFRGSQCDTLIEDISYIYGCTMNTFCISRWILTFTFDTTEHYLHFTEPFTFDSYKVARKPFFIGC